MAIWIKNGYKNVFLLQYESTNPVSNMEAMLFVCSWCQIPCIQVEYWNTHASYKSYIFILCSTYFWPVSYKNLPMQWDDCLCTARKQYFRLHIMYFCCRFLNKVYGINVQSAAGLFVFYLFVFVILCFCLLIKVTFS